MGIDGVEDAEDEGNDSGHGEAEDGSGYEEFVVLFAVELEAELVHDGGGEVEG